MIVRTIILIAFSFCISGSFAGTPRAKKDVLGINANTYLKKSSSGGVLERKTPRSALKMNLSQLGLKNLSFMYEFSFERHLSIGVGFSKFLPRPLPEQLFKNDDPTGQGLRNTSYSGNSVTPEVRFYPGVKLRKQAPHGFYLAAYLRYSKYTLTSNYNDNYNGQTYGYDLTAHYTGTNIGLMLGHQWILFKHVSLDFWILGGGFGKANFDMIANTQGIAIPPDEQANIKRVITDELNKINYLHASDPVVETTDHSVKATMKGLPMTSIRGLGLCLGIAF